MEDYSNPNSHHLPRSLPTARASSSNPSSRDWDTTSNRRKEASVQHHRTVNSNLDTGKGFDQQPPPPHQHHIIHQMNAVDSDHCHHHGGSSSSNSALGAFPRHQPVNPNYKSTDTDGYANYDHPVTVMAPGGVPTLVESREHQPPLQAAAFTYQQLVPSPPAAAAAFGSSLSSSSSAASDSAVLQDDLHRLVNYYTAAHHHPSSHHQLSALVMPPQPQPQQQQLGVSNSTLQQLSAVAAATFSERVLWDWNPAMPDQDYNPSRPSNNNPFK